VVEYERGSWGPPAGRLLARAHGFWPEEPPA